MERFKYTLIKWLVLGGGIFVFYRFFLKEEARAGIKTAVNSVGGAYEKISETITNLTGQVVEEQGLPNREATELQWQRLGF